MAVWLLPSTWPIWLSCDVTQLLWFFRSLMAHSLTYPLPLGAGGMESTDWDVSQREWGTEVSIMYPTEMMQYIDSKTLHHKYNNCFFSRILLALLPHSQWFKGLRSLSGSVLIHQFHHPDLPGLLAAHNTVVVMAPSYKAAILETSVRKCHNVLILSQ